MTAVDLHAVPDDLGDSEFSWQPPHDLLAEQCVLGGMLLSAQAIVDVLEIVKSADFYQPKHAVVFEAVALMHSEGVPVDLVTVGSRLVESGDIAMVGGAPYLHTLVSTVPTAANAGHYARIVLDRAVLRRLIEAGTKITQLGRSAADGGMGTAVEVQERAAKMFSDATETVSGGNLLVPVSDLLTGAYDVIEANNRGEMDRSTVISTGLLDLDAMIGGWRPGQLIIVAARPGMGKSVAATGFAVTAAKLGYPVAMFSLEMTREELMYRLLSAESRVALNRLRLGGMDDLDWQRLVKRTAALSDLPLWLSEERNLTLHTLRGEALRHKKRHGLGMLVVDYVQLLKSTRRHENRQQEVAAIARGLKELAGELGVPAIVPAQLNRNNESRQDKRPLSSDLRESGELEAAADVIILLHRDDYYDDESPRSGEADFIVSKARDAATGTITVASQLHLSRFVDMAV